MTPTDKRLLISESVMVTQIDIHHAREEPDRHVIPQGPLQWHPSLVEESPMTMFLHSMVA
jgi:hypothetical protein